ncbi:MAG TPA: arsenate reductase (glutaredoxin) [Rhizomicrobium sp.]|nr:arsenate reductase (glutaredoxin) [Rhizomicrobium sp.]
MTVTIYHNPSCSNSRKALEIIRAHGIEPKVIEYLKTPLTPQKVRHLMRDELKVPVRDAMRTGESAYADMKLDGADDDTLCAAIAAHPILLNRPIVVTDKGAKLCRPGERVEDLL